ncbi:MAG: ATP-binding protein [Dysgonamonadaceae bacterium]|jgi:AAA15 family ATPase/GTPase|nr:ATP-binding protein [Dysgonamonadaceae bacterium]
MVLEIRLRNIYSIKDEVVLDLRAGGSKSQQTQRLQANTFTCKDGQILKSVAIYGANASGKSNIIKAIHQSVRMILQSHLHNENAVFDMRPFKFDGYPQKPSSFSIRFMIQETEYEYAFSFNHNGIMTENLYHSPNGRRAKIFTRNEAPGKEKSKIYSFTAAIRKPLDVAENTSRKTLYLSRASQMDREIAKTVYKFFAQKIAFNHLSGNLFVYLEFEKSKELLLHALKIADTDIVDFKINFLNKMIDSSYNNNPTSGIAQESAELLPIITFHQNNPKIPFDFAKEESAGTQILFRLMMVILDSVRNNKLLLIEEIGSNLHSKIVEYIIELFHASNSAQIVYTTHNTNLLNLHKLRKDQIYFVNKRIDGSSDLYSLFNYKDFRDTMDVEKAYLQGRFDAIPNIDDRPEILRTLTK